METGQEVVLKSEIYLSDRFPTKEALEAEVDFWDATTAQWVGDCPRRAEYSIEYNIVPKGESYPLSAGRAIHAAFSVYYSTGNRELALAELAQVWGQPSDFRLPSNHKYAHLHLGHLEVILKNYMDFAEKRDTFTPLLVKRDQLDLTDVLAAEWLVTPDDHIVLGESKIVMRFDVDGSEFIYAGKPDLPIRMAGGIYLMDHKSTSGYLSEWWAEQYRFSNQLRGYCAMITKLLPSLSISGALINGIYVGEKASLMEGEKAFKGTRFARFGPFMFQPAHLDEAIRNQYEWRLMVDYFRGRKFWPQHASKMCGGCPFAPLCEASPRTRVVEIQQRYQQNDYQFMAL